LNFTKKWASEKKPIFLSLLDEWKGDE
jgi:hypothetical protein